MHRQRGLKLGFGRPILTGFCLLLLVSGAPAEEEKPRKNGDWEIKLERLRSIPYLAVGKDVIDPADSGVVLYNSAKAQDGYNLFCTSKSTEAYLMDMEGRIVHRWNLVGHDEACSAQHVVFLENGDLMVIMEPFNVMRLDWDSELIWKRNFMAHHDIARDLDGSFYAIAREVRPHSGFQVYFPAIRHFSAAGESLGMWTSYEHLDELKSVLDTRDFLDSVLATLEAGHRVTGRTASDIELLARRRTGEPPLMDYFHMNTIDVLPHTPLGDVDARFREGNFLVCFRNVNQIAVLERETFRPLWAWGAGELQWPHHPTMLENGHILIFDNGVDRRCSRIIEYDVLNDTTAWEYIGDPPESFYTLIGGSCQRLPNGNTLICETGAGTAFEVTAAGEVVWVWLNPRTDRGRRRETLYRMTRLSKEVVEEFLE